MKKGHKIHVLHLASGDLWAGAEVQLFTLIEALQQNTDTIVTVVLLNHGTLEQKLNAINTQVIVIDETLHNSFVIICKLIAILKKHSPDIVHTHRLKENILGAIATRFSHNTISLRTVHGAPEHSPAWFNLPKRLILLIDQLCAQHLQQCAIAVSDELAHILKKRSPKMIVQTITNGINVKALLCINQTTKQPFQEKKHIYKIGIAGRLVPIKRIDLFLKIAQQMLTNQSPYELSFHIYGDGPLRASLEALSKQLKIDKKIKFEGHCEDIHKKIQALDLLLLTSDHEGLPMILLEAMALKTPIISHSVGGITQLLQADTLEKTACGLLANRQQAEDYIKLIDMILKDRKLYTDISNNAYYRVKNFYSADKNASSYYNAYSKYISRQKH